MSARNATGPPPLGHPRCTSNSHTLGIASAQRPVQFLPTDLLQHARTVSTSAPKTLPGNAAPCKMVVPATHAPPVIVVLTRPAIVRLKNFGRLKVIEFIRRCSSCFPKWERYGASWGHPLRAHNCGVCRPTITYVPGRGRSNIC